jgi:hypothetical protein
MKNTIIASLVFAAFSIAQASPQTQPMQPTSGMNTAQSERSTASAPRKKLPFKPFGGFQKGLKTKKEAHQQ